MTRKDDALLKCMRQDCVDIFYQGLAAVDPVTCIHNCCILDNGVFRVNNRAYPLDRFEKIIVLGAGKAGASMGRAMEEILGDRITSGLIIVKTGHTTPLNRITLVEAAHPVPDEKGVQGAQKLLDLACQADEKTLVICLLSGGGSALMTFPAKGLTLSDKQETTKALLGSGAAIHDINTIRKHLSGIKGGLLAKAVYPATLVCLVLSDVVGDDPDIIASGPCTADPGTYGQCLDIIRERGIGQRVPGSVLRHLENGSQGLIPETPKQGDKAFERVTHTIIASNIKSLEAALEKAESLGYHSLILSSLVEGETRDVAAFHAAIAKQVLATGHPVNPPACLLSGGETTVTIKGKGKGGRNQEFALAAALKIKGKDAIVILSAGTDGTDGPTEAAGAVVDHTTIQRAWDVGLKPEEYLEDNNAFVFFDRLSDLFITGPTHTNVMDLRIMLIR